MNKVYLLLILINIFSCQAKDPSKDQPVPAPTLPAKGNGENTKLSAIEKCLEKKFQFKKNPEINAIEFNKIIETSLIDCKESEEDLEKYFGKFKIAQRLLDEIRILDEEKKGNK